MTNVLGYMVLVSISALSGEGKWWDVVSFGDGNEPSHADILRRGRAELFATKEDAERAIKETCDHAKERGDTWVKSAKFKIVPVVKTVLD